MSLSPLEAPLLHKAIPSLPIVFVTVIDRVRSGFVESEARPGGNVTGFTAQDGQGRGVLLLENRPHDELIEEAKAMLREWTPAIAGVEAWDGPRVVYRTSVDLP